MIYPETGQEVKKLFFISVPYFPGLSESYKKIFKYTTIQVCFKGINTLKVMLMHPKDKVPDEHKKDLDIPQGVSGQDRCKSSYVGETSRALGEMVKEHSKSATSAIHKHCIDFHQPLPGINDFNIIDQEPSQIIHERPRRPYKFEGWTQVSTVNIGKMSIPHCFDPLISAKPRHPHVDSLSRATPSVEELSPSQIPGLNLIQFFNNIGNFDPNPSQHINKCSSRACRAKICSINWVNIKGYSKQ